MSFPQKLYSIYITVTFHKTALSDTVFYYISYKSIRIKFLHIPEETVSFACDSTSPKHPRIFLHVQFDAPMFSDLSDLSPKMGRAFETESRIDLLE